MAIVSFYIKSVIAKQFEGSRIKRMCIFHVLTVRGLPGSEGDSASRMGLPGNAEAPLAMCLHVTMMLECHLEFFSRVLLLTNDNKSTFISLHKVQNKNPWSGSKPTGYLSSATILGICGPD